MGEQLQPVFSGFFFLHEEGIADSRVNPKVHGVSVVTGRAVEYACGIEGHGGRAVRCNEAHGAGNGGLPLEGGFAELCQYLDLCQPPIFVCFRPLFDEAFYFIVSFQFLVVVLCLIVQVE